LAAELHGKRQPVLAAPPPRTLGTLAASHPPPAHPPGRNDPGGGRPIGSHCAGDRVRADQGQRSARMQEVLMAHTSARFPVGYHDLHPDVSLNYQLNRFWNWVGELEMLDELRRIAPNLTNYHEWVRELLALGEQALAEGRMLAGAYLIRA